VCIELLYAVYSMNQSRGISAVFMAHSLSACGLRLLFYIAVSRSLESIWVVIVCRCVCVCVWEREREWEYVVTDALTVVIKKYIDCLMGCIDWLAGWTGFLNNIYICVCLCTYSMRISPVTCSTLPRSQASENCTLIIILSSRPLLNWQLVGPPVQTNSYLLRVIKFGYKMMMNKIAYKKTMKLPLRSAEQYVEHATWYRSIWIGTEFTDCATHSLGWDVSDFFRFFSGYSGLGN